ncbi:hypothetical protein MAR_023746, partial [Mya arenaria]
MKTEPELRLIKADDVVVISELESGRMEVVKVDNVPERKMTTDVNGNSKPLLTVVRHMRELHKQHQDKLEDITSRFDGIKVTLSEKVDTLRSECERLRERARHCEDALQRDSDFKVQ